MSGWNKARMSPLYLLVEGVYIMDSNVSVHAYGCGDRKRIATTHKMPFPRWLATRKQGAKRCCVCGELKQASLDNFYLRKASAEPPSYSSVDPLLPNCIECERARNRVGYAKEMS